MGVFLRTDVLFGLEFGVRIGGGRSMLLFDVFNHRITSCVLVVVGTPIWLAAGSTTFAS